MAFDLLTTVESGGCSAKIPAAVLKEILKDIPFLPSEKLLVGNDKSDDALVYKINDETALIQTTDFFPPVCSDPYDFGQIAAANALSDIFAMGGEAITALNIVLFPSAKLSISILKEILAGGAEKVIEAGAVLAGGHTIDDDIPKYGLAATGVVHPDKIITNAAARAGDVLVLTKALGTGTLIAGRKIGETSEQGYLEAVKSMKQLNRKAAQVMQGFGIVCATDVTGFSLCGHALEVAEASRVSIVIETGRLPLLDDCFRLTDMGCIPGATFRNLNAFTAKIDCSDSLEYNRKMIALDAQTSGGLLACCPEEMAESFIDALKEAGYNRASVVGRVEKKQPAGKQLFLR